jgi:hypothetical protein
MKTFIIDIDGLANDLSKELMGFVLTIGLNFRKIDSSLSGRVLIIELSSKVEENALKQFLANNNIRQRVTIGSDNKAIVDGRKAGVFTQVKSTEGLSEYYSDKSTGKKFTIVK